MEVLATLALTFVAWYFLGYPSVSFTTSEMWILIGISALIVFGVSSLIQRKVRLSGTDCVAHLTPRVIMLMAVLLLAAYLAMEMYDTFFVERIKNTGGALLVSDSEEDTGYGLYSYLLFGSRPSESSRDRYLASLKAYVELVEPIEFLRDYWSRGQINITYLPVETDVPGWLKPTSETPKDLLDNYNYTRAQAILNALQKEGPLSDGPYIVSYRRPLSGTIVTEHYLLQDLSSVPVRLVRLWVKEFLNRVREPNYWKKRPMKDIALQLRTHIGRLAEFFDDLPPEIRENLRSMVAQFILVERPGRQ